MSDDPKKTKDQDKSFQTIGDELAKSSYHSCVTIGANDDPEFMQDSSEFDNFLKVDTKTCNGSPKDTSNRDSTIHFHNLVPGDSPRSVIINNTVVLNDKPSSIEQSLSSRLLNRVFIKQAVLMVLWYIASFITIIQNKYLLSSLDLDPGVLGFCQILMTTLFGCCMMYFPFGGCRSSKPASSSENFNRCKFFKTMTILGFLRFGSIICSIISLKFVAVSFTETIKSSAPLFTAVTAYFLLGEYHGVYVNLSLIPIMSGLAISTSTEISFNMTGFLAAIANNVLDCTQNVFSKKLLSSKEQSYSPLELQFYTSVAATLIQIPFYFTLMDMNQKILKIDRYTVWMLLFNGAMFYAQSLFAYALMSLISPVTFSVSNTVKRAGLIWFSVLVFGNAVTVMGGLGTLLVIFGVFLYQRAQQMEADLSRLSESETDENDDAEG